MKVAGFALVASIFAGSAFAQTPTIRTGDGLLNAFSFMNPSLPNYGIARGSIFALFGTDLAPTTLQLSVPLGTSSNGVSLSVTVNGTTTAPLLYYISSSQINAVLPSATPSGIGTLTVTTPSGTSAPYPITVVESAFGLLTWNYGTGPAKGYDASIDPHNQYVFFSLAEAVNPNDILELWGTGLGAVTDDVAGGAVSLPAEVDIGGIKAEVQYHGRSQFPGLDQINVKVPQNVSGCNVSVVVVTGSGADSRVSNFATLPVAPSGRTCTDPLSPLSSDMVTKIFSTGSFSSGFITLNKTTTPGTTVGGVTIGGGTTDSGYASFTKITSAQFIEGAQAAASGSASIGSCLVNFYTTSGGAPPPAFQVTYLNAGPDVNINGPNGLLAMPLQTSNGITFYSTPSSNTSFIPASGGAFTFDNGSGGPDVGGFTAQLQMAAPLVWSNKADLATVTRSNGVTVNWTGGDPATYVNITGLSLGSVAGSDTNFVAGFFSCQAPTSAGTFTVPASVLVSLPPSFTISEGGITISTSTLSLSNLSVPVTFTATGLDLGLVETSVTDTISTNYQ